MIAARLVAPLAEPSAPSAVPPPLLPPVQRGLARRHVVLGLPSLAGLATAASVAAPHAAYAAASPLSSAAGGQLSVGGELPADSLAARLVTTGQLKQPGNQPPWPWIPKQTYYPKWMFGEWQVDMEFTGLRLPLGKQLVPAGFLDVAEAPAEAGGLGSRYSFTQRFYSTLPPTFDNELRVQLGLGMPQDAIIADRAFNTRQTTNAFLGWQAVESVAYDATEAPLRETVTLSRTAPDGSALPPRRLELYINALSSEDGIGDDTAFYTSELCRQVLLGVRQAEVKDYEIMHSWRRVKSDLVEGRQRSCLYLQPQEPGFFKAGGRAVAVYDYSFTMKRNAAPDDAPRGAVACVPTPKDVVQCV
ncbi:hypothetical protein D9Q98_008117 [Chlorella vulgaris]|uniref:DUF6816 domain-containing protein n=1 Tax=Chlorella vulgaris TaxID=3077 RepID=A0A9D4TG60_CHLVU|nr:hypothetical protein D9Q98_008117 [Chlorella vulgaris]